MSTEDQQRAMFGTTTADLEHEWAVNTTMMLSPAHYIGCILSDVQEAMSHGQLEQARQWTNKAKYFLMEKFPNGRYSVQTNRGGTNA